MAPLRHLSAPLIKRRDSALAVAIGFSRAGTLRMSAMTIRRAFVGQRGLAFMRAVFPPRFGFAGAGLMVTFHARFSRTQS